MSRSDPNAFRKMCFMLAQWIEAPKNQTELAALLNKTIDEYHQTHPEVNVSQTLVDVSPGFAQPMLKTLLPKGQAHTAKAEFEYVVVNTATENLQSQKRFSPARSPSAASTTSAESEKKPQKGLEEARSQQASPAVSEKDDEEGWGGDELPPISSRNFHRVAPAPSVRSSHANLANHSVAVSQAKPKTPTCREEGIDASKAKDVFKSILNQEKYWPEKPPSWCFFSFSAPTLAVFIIHALVKKLDFIFQGILKTDEKNTTGEFSRVDCLAVFKELSCPVSAEKAKEIFQCIATAQVKLVPNTAAVPV